VRRARIAIIVFVGSLAGACGDDTPQGGAGSTSTTVAPETTTSAPAPTTSTTVERELSEASRLRLDGIGPVKIGMSLEEASAAVGRKVAVDETSLIQEPGEATCGFADVEDGPAGLSFMVLRDNPGAEWKIYRVDVFDTSRIATGGGIRNGSTEDEVKQVYGDKMKVEPHTYTGPEGHYLVLDVDGEGGYMLLFETDGTKVLQFRSGNDEAVRAPRGLRLISPEIAQLRERLGKSAVPPSRRS
jgi:hypothetical protein